jgi:hypothetical protein
LDITASFVTIDLAGFTISGPGDPLGLATAIATEGETSGITVRNGSISGFGTGVAAGSSIVEGLRVFNGTRFGIVAGGIVKGNIVDGIFQHGGAGISATGIVTGNYVTNSRDVGIEIGQGSTVIGNTATHNGPNPGFGIVVDCPSNLTDNTAVNNAGTNLVLNGEGCHNDDNVAP